MTTPRTGPGSAQAEPLGPCDRPADCGAAGNEDRQAKGRAPDAAHMLETGDPSAGRGGQVARDPVSGALEDVEAVCQQSLRAMRQALERFEAGTGTAADVVAEGVLLRRAFLSLFDERKRLGQLDPTGRGAGGNGSGVPVASLDLAAARAEIRRRLDRLRACTGGGEVP